jgi:hypothetical protein
MVLRVRYEFQAPVLCVCVGVLVICILIFTVFCIVSFINIYSYLFRLY